MFPRLIIERKAAKTCEVGRLGMEQLKIDDDSRSTSRNTSVKVAEHHNFRTRRSVADVLVIRQRPSISKDRYRSLALCCRQQLYKYSARSLRLAARQNKHTCMLYDSTRVGPHAVGRSVDWKQGLAVAKWAGRLSASVTATRGYRANRSVAGTSPNRSVDTTAVATTKTTTTTTS
uniref:Uncharacterized protein n=1 Tax=Plectus sambesii TaxID=2011161 RepID=A0A914W1F1_9BILA